MLHRKKNLLALVVVTSLVAAVVQAKMNVDQPPDLVMEKTTTKGIFGTVVSSAWIFTAVCLQFINSVLIHTRNMQLPCTIYSLSTLEYSCTPYIAQVIDDSGPLMAN